MYDHSYTVHFLCVVYPCVRFVDSDREFKCTTNPHPIRAVMLITCTDVNSVFHTGLSFSAENEGMIGVSWLQINCDLGVE